MSRARKRAKDAPTFVAAIPLRVTPTQAKEVAGRFECARLLYNACLRVALDRAQAMRADPRWEQAKAMPQVVAGRPNPARASAFRQLRARHGFTEWALASAASGFRVGWLREKVFAQEAQVLGARAFDAANRWMLGQRGRPRFKGKGRGLHSLACKDRNGALRIAADGSGLQWGTGLVLPFVFDERNPYQWWAAWHIAEGRLRSCRIVRTRLRGRWVYVAQLVLDGRPLSRYQVSEGLAGLDVGPSAIAVVTDQGAWKEAFCAELDDKARQRRRLQRRLDRQHRAGSPTCFDQQGRHQQGGCNWRFRSRQAERTATAIAELHRRLAEHRKSLHGNLANRILGRGRIIHTEKLSYRAMQRRFGRSVGRRAPGMFITILSRKAVSAGGMVALIDTRTTRLSQACVCGAVAKKPLSQRTHRCGCGAEADRDVFSAFLVRHVDPTAHPHLLDVGSAAVAFPVLQDSGAGRRRAVFNRRVPQAQPVGYGATRQSRSAASPQSAADAPAGERQREPGIARLQAVGGCQEHAAALASASRSRQAVGAMGGGLGPQRPGDRDQAALRAGERARLGQQLHPDGGRHGEHDGEHPEVAGEPRGARVALRDRQRQRQRRQPAGRAGQRGGRQRPGDAQQPAGQQRDQQDGRQREDQLPPEQRVHAGPPSTASIGSARPPETARSMGQPGRDGPASHRREEGATVALLRLAAAGVAAAVAAQAGPALTAQPAERRPTPRLAGPLAELLAARGLVAGPLGEHGLAHWWTLPADPTGWGKGG
jgi:putative transposase